MESYEIARTICDDFWLKSPLPRVGARNPRSAEFHDQFLNLPYSFFDLPKNPNIEYWWEQP